MFYYSRLKLAGIITSLAALFPMGVFAHTQLPSAPAIAAASSKAELDATRNAAPAINQAFQEKFGNVPEQIVSTPIPGIYQVIMGTEVVYMDATGRYMLGSHVVDLQKNTTLEAGLVQALTKTKLASLNLNDAIHIVHGTGVRTIYTFEDANCGFCKKLSAEFAKVPDVTIYTFPVQFLGEDSGMKAKKMWCSIDRPGVWAAYMANATVTATRTDCDTSMLERNYTQATLLKVQGTPAIFFADGTRIPGYAVAADIEKHLHNQVFPSKP